MSQRTQYSHTGNPSSNEEQLLFNNSGALRPPFQLRNSAHLLQTRDSGLRCLRRKGLLRGCLRHLLLGRLSGRVACGRPLLRDGAGSRFPGRVLSRLRSRLGPQKRMTQKPKSHHLSMSWHESVVLNPKGCRRLLSKKCKSVDLREVGMPAISGCRSVARCLFTIYYQTIQQKASVGCKSASSTI